MYKGAIDVPEFAVLLQRLTIETSEDKLVGEVTDLLRRVNLGRNQEAIAVAADENLRRPGIKEAKQPEGGMLTWKDVRGIPVEPESHSIGGPAQDRMPRIDSNFIPDF
jgi:hypothetical protein